MNKKQQALYDAVVAAGGEMWVVSSMTYYRGKKVATEGRDQMNAAQSLLSEAHQRYCPGGFRREVKLSLVEEQKVERYRPDPESKIWMVSEHRFLVKVI